jgi:hypothetical protein
MAYLLGSVVKIMMNFLFSSSQRSVLMAREIIFRLGEGWSWHQIQSALLNQKP